MATSPGAVLARCRPSSAGQGILHCGVASHGLVDAAEHSKQRLQLHTALPALMAVTTSVCRKLDGIFGPRLRHPQLGCLGEARVVPRLQRRPFLQCPTCSWAALAEVRGRRPAGGGLTLRLVSLPPTLVHSGAPSPALLCQGSSLESASQLQTPR